MRIALAALVLALPLLAATPKPKVQFTTSMGSFVVQLEPEVAPLTVANFLKYVKKGQYDGTLFHRVKPSAPAIIQGGGHLPDLTKKPTDGSIKNEAELTKKANLLNKAGTLAMARESLPDSAKAQFFINLKDNPDLDHKARNLVEFGYATFGKVVKGMDVVQKIGKVKTTTKGGMTDVPVKDVMILSAKELQ